MSGGKRNYLGKWRKEDGEEGCKKVAKEGDKSTEMFLDDEQKRCVVHS